MCCCSWIAKVSWYSIRKPSEVYAYTTSELGRKNMDHVFFTEPTCIVYATVWIVLIRNHNVCSQVDVIFCTSEKDLALGKGAVSRSISEVAGPGLQDECKQKYPQGINYGEVVRTGGHNLRCQAVYHGVCPRWDSSGGRTEKVLHVFRFV